MCFAALSFLHAKPCKFYINDIFYAMIQKKTKESQKVLPLNSAANQSMMASQLLSEQDQQCTVWTNSQCAASPQYTSSPHLIPDFKNKFIGNKRLKNEI